MIVGDVTFARWTRPVSETERVSSRNDPHFHPVHTVIRMGSGNSTKRLKNANLHVDPSTHPGWLLNEKGTPSAGETVYCTEGKAEVAKVCGMTGDGSRLLELRLLDKTAPPFFAAASNVLIPARSNGGRSSRATAR
jgi:hypothetical protein